MAIWKQYRLEGAGNHARDKKFLETVAMPRRTMKTMRVIIAKVMEHLLLTGGSGKIEGFMGFHGTPLCVLFQLGFFGSGEIQSTYGLVFATCACFFL